MARALFALVFYALFPLSAEAKFIRMVPNWEVSVDDAKKSVHVKWSIKNEGDEVSKDVGLEIPVLGDMQTLSPSVSPGEEVKTERNIPYSKLGITGPGSHGFSFRVLYKDANSYPFSGPYVLTFEVTRPPGFLPRVEFEDEDVDVVSSDWTTFRIRNDSTTDITVEKIDAAFPREVSTTIEFDLPQTIKPSGEAKGTIRFTKTGALVGSSYPVGILVSGKSGDLSFAMQGGTLVRIVQGRMDARLAMKIAFLAAGLGVLAQWAYGFYLSRKASYAG